MLHVSLYYLKTWSRCWFGSTLRFCRLSVNWFVYTNMYMVLTKIMASWLIYSTCLNICSCKKRELKPYLFPFSFHSSLFFLFLLTSAFSTNGGKIFSVRCLPKNNDIWIFHIRQILPPFLDIWCLGQPIISKNWTNQLVLIIICLKQRGVNLNVQE